MKVELEINDDITVVGDSVFAGRYDSKRSGEAVRALVGDVVRDKVRRIVLDRIAEAGLEPARYGRLGVDVVADNGVWAAIAHLPFDLRLQEKLAEAKPEESNGGPPGPPVPPQRPHPRVG